MINEILIPVGILAGLGLLFAIILAVAYKKLRVEEDPRIDEVEEMLPHANCGACGEAGCRVFAEKVVGNEVKISKCTVSSQAAIERIAAYLGVEAGAEEKRVARLLCAGGKREAHSLAEYAGTLRTCRGEAVVTGGPKACAWGCLGLGDCVTACDFDALYLNDDGLPTVIPDKCTACGDCVEICPKNLFELMPESRKLIVQCKSLLEGSLAESKCSVACTACGRCVADAEPGLIEIRSNLAVINYELNHLASPEATLRCPTNAIVWVEDQQFEKRPTVWLPLGRVEKYTEEV
ncbi:MAG: RnfABCDGE type electron transport complex subunit B [Lewinellaceae bacterium]|nr:RnfABCDGE type electron transport complex subunit B [Phaeodactylibacter sp.]MCB9035318.1 RnfABCDGE type electron transport complex subunit B [Lewinellaceae bacterium]